MDGFGPFPESDFYCPIKGEVCEPYGLAVYCSWKNETDNISLRTQLEQARANSIIQEKVIKNGYEPADRDKIIRLILEKSSLKSQIAQAEAANVAMRAALESIRRLWSTVTDRAYRIKQTRFIVNKALSSDDGKDLLEELRRLRALFDDIYPMIAGRTIQLIEAGEEKASAQWNEICQRMLAAKEDTGK